MKDLGATDLFRNLDAPELEALRKITQERAYPAGTRIFTENEPGDGVYVIRDGSVEIAHLVGERALCVFSKFGPGDFFGEMSVIDELPRSATTTAVKDTSAYFIPRDEMAALLRRSPELSFKLLREISKRLRDFNQHHLREIIQAERLATIGNFARSIVHDLKTPLTVINMATEIMSAPNAPLEIRRDSFVRVKRQVRSITEMIGDILDFTQSGRVNTALPMLNYREFMANLLQELSAEAALKTVRVEFENEPPDIKLPFDPHRLRRVILNLLHNAADMMPEGGRILFRFQHNGKMLTTEIQDSGPGIAPEVAGRLFQAFVTFGKEHGTGLGLSICKKIIEDHGGTISARNAAGGGAIFSFSLPVPQT